ncbi:MAG TPA: tetratricopeptide repeat protein [Bryobacteraceae bacterium]|jgi:tetratricopeptide (TPR) repeat protein|nr:tetratricopeptide repeat protein [Bryobacteraceae bacterium]
MVGKLKGARGLSRGFQTAVLLVLGCTFALAQVPLDGIAKAEDLYQHTDFEASLALLDKHSNDAAVNFLLGRDYFSLGDFKKSAELLEKATTEDPTNSEYEDWLGRAYGRRAETSNPLFAPGHASKARKAFERAVVLNPKSSEALADLFDFYLEAPGFLGGGYDKAMGVANQMAAIDPAEGYFAKAQLAQKQKDLQEAEFHLRQAIASAPREVGKLLALAKLLSNEGRTQESDALFQQADQVSPNTPRVWFAWADTLIKEKHNLPEAKTLLQKYVQAQLTPDDPPKSKASKLLKQVEVAENGA